MHTFNKWPSIWNFALQPPLLLSKKFCNDPTRVGPGKNHRRGLVSKAVLACYWEPLTFQKGYEKGFYGAFGGTNFCVLYHLLSFYSPLIKRSFFMEASKNEMKFRNYWYCENLKTLISQYQCWHWYCAAISRNTWFPPLPDGPKIGAKGAVLEGLRHIFDTPRESSW